MNYSQLIGQLLSILTIYSYLFIILSRMIFFSSAQTLNINTFLIYIMEMIYTSSPY